MAGKYASLTDHLATLASAGRQGVELSFTEIADLVGQQHVVAAGGVASRRLEGRLRLPGTLSRVVRST